jgi:hypothetical protein
VIDADSFAGASPFAMREHLTAPLRVGAMDLPVSIDAAGAIDIAMATREPLLMLWPLVGLEDDALLVQATVTDGAIVQAPVDLVYAPYTEAGAPLPVYRPAADPQSGVAGPFSVALTGRRRSGDGTLSNIAAAEISTLLGGAVIEGITGRMLILLGAEKPRMRRAGRELAAQVRLSRARDHALDRHGADLGVARFAEALTVSNQQVTTQDKREADAAYRRRLGLYRPFLMPTRAGILEMLNGPSTGPNAGPLAALGVDARFTLTDTPNPVALAVHLVGGGQAGQNRRNDLIAAIRTAHLIWPLDNAASNGAHSGRPLAAPIARQQSDLRAAVRSACSFTGSIPAIAPMLAAALARVGLVRGVLGVNAKLAVTCDQDSTAGSRYELGLGVDLIAPSAAELDSLAATATSIKPADIASPEARAILAGAAPVASAEDPDGAWLFSACGLRTVHRVTGTELYVSHLPVLGLRIDAPDSGLIGAQLAVAAYDEAPGDAAANGLLTASVSAAVAAWGGPKPIVLPAPATAAWTAVTPRPAGDRALGVFAAAGLPSVGDPTAAVARLQTMPPELVSTLRLGPAQAARVLGTGTAAAAATELAALAATLRDNGIASLLPLVSGTDVLLIASVSSLPEAGLNLAGRRGESFRWYQVAVHGDNGDLVPSGARTTFTPTSDGVTALVCVGYARRGLVDPYEYRIELPPGELLGLEAYEFLMNLLDHAHPLGVQVNTWTIRHDHVDVGETGSATPLTPSVSRTYRRFQRRRLRGADGVGLED